MKNLASNLVPLIDRTYYKEFTNHKKPVEFKDSPAKKGIQKHAYNKSGRNTIYPNKQHAK